MLVIITISQGIIQGYIIDMTTIILELDDCEFEYEPADTPVARIWVQQIRDLTEHTPVPGYCRKIKNSWIKRSYADADGLLARINLLLAQMDRQPISGTRDSLNRLHQEFQLSKSDDPHHREWHQLNLLIHEMEFVDHSQIRANLGCYAEYGPELDRPLITPELRPYWGYYPQGGDLCLGYHTVGKDLGTAWRDQDEDIVRAHMIQPQERISPELVAYLGPMQPRFNPLVNAEIQKWLRSAGMGQHIDFNDPRYQYQGQPLLGKLIKSPSLADMMWLRDSHQIRAIRIWD